MDYIPLPLKNAMTYPTGFDLFDHLDDALVHGLDVGFIGPLGCLGCCVAL